MLWVACALAAQAQTATEIVLHSFGGLPRGAHPEAPVIRDAAGNLYGTAHRGGAVGGGVVYKIDTAGNQTVLHNFTGGADGGKPVAGVIRDAAGSLYGTTQSGGASDLGVVYKLDTGGHETVLHSFAGGNDGAQPYAGVIMDPAGNLYGTTEAGGASNQGVVYKVDAAGRVTVLYSFAGYPDAGAPASGVVRDEAGNLYGTTVYGGTQNSGAVYKLDAAGRETVLYSFTGGPDGGGPGGVIREPAGNLYGTTSTGGTNNVGVVYELDTAGQETVLYSFTGGADGGSPNDVIRDSAGNLYGTTYLGGPASAYAGVVYKLDTAGQETVLYSFTGGSDGAYAEAGLAAGEEGTLYGTTWGGGAVGGGADGGFGVIFKVNPAGEETVLYAFPGAPEGSFPAAGVLRDPAGNLYGTTFEGGAHDAGVVYKVDAAGQETVLYSFTGGADGGNPDAGVTRDAAGNLYGTTLRGGAAGGYAGFGVVYKVDPTGHETVLHTFTGGADGWDPSSGVVLDAAGNLYGTAGEVVYKLDPGGNLTVLYTFTGGADGSLPKGDVIRDPEGNLYGATWGGGIANWGVVFKVDPAGHEAVLHSFTGGADGGTPYAGVIRDSAGNLYGTTFEGGTARDGVVYKLDPAGQETVLYTFTDNAGGGAPYSALARDAAGSLYGTNGGPTNAVAYKLDTAGNETVLYSFSNNGGGESPSGLILDEAGNLYGTTYSGGKNTTGVVFEIKP